MDLIQVLILAIIQGLTEFLPISSSAHLILLHHLTTLPDQGQTIDIAVHFGTLIAVITYFREDSKKVWFGLIKLLQGNVLTADSFTALCLIVATVPAVILDLQSNYLVMTFLCGTVFY